MLSLAAIANNYLYVTGEGHFTSDLTASGAVKTTNGYYTTGSPYCEYLDGKAKRCIIRAALTSTGGLYIPTPPAIFRVRNTNATFGFTGSAAILRLVVATSVPGEALTVNCGTTTGTTLGNSRRSNLMSTAQNASGTYIMATGSVLQTQFASGIILGQNRYVECTSVTTHEAAAGLTGEATLEVMEVN